MRPLCRFVSQYLMTNLNLLEGTVNHGNEHVEQHYHHGHVVNSIQHVTNVLDEFVSIIDHDRPDLRQSKDSPEQRLEALLQAGQTHIEGNRRRPEASYFCIKQTMNHQNRDDKDALRKNNREGFKAVVKITV